MESRGNPKKFQYDLVPGPKFGNSREVLSSILPDATRIQIAVAFVTHSGVDMFADLLRGNPGRKVELVARGAPITQPSALLALSELGVDVSVKIGASAPGFHPKLWLVSDDTYLRVLSGSGNLTSGGLVSNSEQFEFFQIDRESVPMVAAQEARFGELTFGARPLSEVRDSPYWASWEAQTRAREELFELEHELDDELARVGAADDALVDLHADLLDLYERTKAEVRIPTDGGGYRRYVPNRFKGAIDRGARSGLLVPVVAGIVRESTGGFGYLAAAQRPDLMVETLVLDDTASYHHLFSETTKANARSRMNAYWAAQDSKS